MPEPRNVRSGQTTITPSGLVGDPPPAPEATGEPSAKAAPVDFPPGTVLGPYRIVGRIGSGGMGAVYEAEDDHGRRVALKSLDRVHPVRLLFLKREFRFLTRVSHPNVLELYELLVADGNWFFTMPLVAGRPFAAALAGWRDQPDGEARLRALLRQLAEGVDALHAAGLLHLDLKAENVLVDGADRVRILDFGLVRRADAGDQGAPRGGTPNHMAPEQAMGRPVGAAADWYAVGVMMYQAIAGHPYTPGILEAPAGVVRGPAPPIEPADLVALATALLARDPEARPPGVAILSRLGGAAAPRRPATPFVGRDADLQVLRDAYAEAERGTPVSVWVVGGSGMGKSALLGRWLDEIAGRAIVLRGRCFEREHVPFRGFDALVDDLAVTLRTLRGGRAARADDADLAAAARLFPTIPLSDAAPAPADPAADPATERARAVDGLKGVLRRLRGLGPVVLVIDDVDWGDVDSARLWGALLAPPDPPALLLVGSYRPETTASPFLQELDEVRRRQRFEERHLRLAPLPAVDAASLVGAIRGGDDAAAVARLIRECDGSPFLLETLAREAVQPTGGASALPELVRTRLAAVPPGAEDLARLVAALGQPARVELLLSLAPEVADPVDALVHLQSVSLVRLDGLRDEDLVEMHHDRFRQALLGMLAPDERAALHRRVAIGLEARGDTGPDVLADHFFAAGLLDPATRYAEQAADQALAALAFGRAASLYARAMGWVPEGSPAATRLASGHARALYDAGRVLEAADAWARLAPGLPDVDRRAAERRAAEASMLGGRIPEGVGILQGRLRELGLPTRRSAPLTVGSVLFHLAWLMVRGTEARAAPAVPDPDAAERVDLCWALGKGLAYVLPVDGIDFVLRSIRLALLAGDGRRAARALAFLAGGVFHQVRPLQRMSLRYLAHARAEAERTGAADLLASMGAWEGMVALGSGQWEDAERRLAHTVDELTERPAGFHWERQVAAGLLVWLHQNRGDLTRSREEAIGFLREAHDRGDLYGLVLFRQYVAYADVARGELAEAREQTRWIREDWAHGEFTIPSYYSTLIEVLADLYTGDVGEAARRWAAIQPAFRKGGGEFAPPTLIDNSLLEARVIVAGGLDAAGQKRLGKLAARLEGVPRRDAPALASWVRATANPEWRTTAGLAALERSAHELRLAGLPMHAACVLHHVATASDRADLLGETDQRLRTDGVADPDRSRRALTPTPA